MNQPVDAVGAAMNPDPGTATNDSSWMLKAYVAGVQEAELADHVKNQLSNRELQKLAETMSNEHHRINEEMKAFAMKKNIKLPDGATKNETDEWLAKNTQNGPAFDKAYADKLIDDHNQAVELYSSISQKATDADIRAFFEQKLDLIKHHLYMANIVRDSVIINKSIQK
jgi:putative membrane protein